MSGAVAAMFAILVVGCASGSDGDAATSPPSPASAEVAGPEATAAEPSAVTDPVEVTDPFEVTDPVAVTDPVEVTDPVDGESEPSLPADGRPEDSVDPVETASSDTTEQLGVERKDVVTRSADAVGDGVLPEGVGSVTAQVTSPSGTVCEVCLWLADDDASRRRGLMGVTDLGDAVGMAFVWDQPRTGNFFMFQTPTPLSIAWFDESGTHVGQADMDPCLVDDSATCERYTADSPYVVAVEMFGGQLDAIGIGPGASIELLDIPCS